MEWNVYMSDKDHSNQERMVVTTPWLVWFLVFGEKRYIVTINKRKAKVSTN
jgi:hypothetical protein